MGWGPGGVQPPPLVGTQAVRGQAARRGVGGSQQAGEGGCGGAGHQKGRVWGLQALPLQQTQQFLVRFGVQAAVPSAACAGFAIPGSVNLQGRDGPPAQLACSKGVCKGVRSMLCMWLTKKNNNCTCQQHSSIKRVCVALLKHSCTDRYVALPTLPSAQPRLVKVYAARKEASATYRDAWKDGFSGTQTPLSGHKVLLFTKGGTFSTVCHCS